MKQTRTIQSSEILKKLKIKNIEDGKVVLDFLLDFFVYLPIGDTIVTPQVNFKKVDDNFIQLEVKIKKEEMLDMLEKSNTIKLL